MVEDANISDNIEPSEAPIPRRPGRPKGLPKPPGSGRKKNTPNRVTRDVREAAAKHGPKALQAFVKLLGHPDPKIVSVAAREILDRAYGKPISPSEITGKDGEPLVPARAMSDRDLAQMIVFTLSKSVHDEGATLLPTRTPAKPAPTPDPFAAERARQAAEIAAIPSDGDTSLGGYAEAVAAQKAEDALALAECRQARPAPIWVAPSGSSAEHGLTSDRPSVVSFNPRHRPR